MNHFEPSAERALECRAEMDAALWWSVRELFDEAAPDGSLSEPLAESRFAEGPTSFLDYGSYFDLALVPPEDDEVPAEAQASARAFLARRLATLGDIEAEPGPPAIVRFDEATFAPRELAQMHRWWDIESANHMAMINPSDDEFERVRGAAAQALDYLALGCPELHGEVEAIVRHIVLTRPDGVNNRINYSGASSFALWGALTVNAETQREWMQVFRQIVHETAHNLLFGIARDGGLVDDDPKIRRASPIRNDARPTDGVFHAAFVSAREAMAFDQLLVHDEKHGILPEGDAQILDDMLQISAIAFHGAIPTLRAEDVQLTELGDAVLSDCEAYMREAFAIEPIG